MPELPELEAFVRAQRQRLCAEPVAEVPVAHFATLKTVDPPPAALVGRRFSEVRRRAKRLLFETEDAGPVLMVHLMSAGRLAVGPGHPKSSVLAVRFEDDTELAMTEGGRKRRAGAWLLAPEAVAEQLAHIGPEPLDPAFDTAALKAALEQHPHRLHAFLRDQRAIAGIGRAYANEILHAARLSPYANGASLTTEQLVPLSQKGLAAKAGHDYRVHDRLGRQCPVCGNEIRQVSFDEHTIYYCPTCQTDGRVLADRRLSRLLRD